MVGARGRAVLPRLKAETCPAKLPFIPARRFCYTKRR